MADVSAAAQAEAMDRMYRFTRHVYDLTRKPYLLGRDRMLAALEIPAGGSVLEVGCGTGRNLAAAAALRPDARYFGLDISKAMLETAAGTIRRSGLGDRVALAEADATRFDPVRLFGRRRFDRVYLSYSLSMIPDWRAALAEALAATAADGRLAVVDFGPADRMPAPARALLWRWLALFHVEPRIALGEEMARLGRREGRPLSLATPHGGYCQIAMLGPAAMGADRLD